MPKAPTQTSYADLSFWSETLDDMERTRIAMENRLRSWPTAPSLEMVNMLEKALANEGAAIKRLEKVVDAHPLADFINESVGIGLKQAGRFLGTIGDPYIRPPIVVDDVETEATRPRRGPAELWAYCGYSVIEGEAPRHKRGEQGNYNDKARQRAYLIASQVVKFTGLPDKNGRVGPRSPYRDIYDDARAKYASAAHTKPCIRCGPSGKPAKTGSPLNDGHRHARAIRIVAKTILKDLFLEARDLTS